MCAGSSDLSVGCDARGGHLTSLSDHNFVVFGPSHPIHCLVQTHSPSHEQQIRFFLQTFILGDQKFVSFWLCGPLLHPRWVLPSLQCFPKNCRWSECVCAEGAFKLKCKPNQGPHCLWKRIQKLKAGFSYQGPSHNSRTKTAGLGSSAWQLSCSENR